MNDQSAQALKGLEEILAIYETNGCAESLTMAKAIRAKMAAGQKHRVLDRALQCAEMLSDVIENLLTDIRALESELYEEEIDDTDH